MNWFAESRRDMVRNVYEIPHFDLLPCRAAPARLDSVSSAAVGPNTTLLKRKLNEGMDFAAHNTTISYLQSENQLK